MYKKKNCPLNSFLFKGFSDPARDKKRIRNLKFSRDFEKFIKVNKIEELPSIHIPNFRFQRNNTSKNKGLFIKKKLLLNYKILYEIYFSSFKKKWNSS